MEYLIKSSLLSMSCTEFNHFLDQLVTITGRKSFIEILLDDIIRNKHEHHPFNSRRIKLTDTISIISSIISRRNSNNKLIKENENDTNQETDGVSKLNVIKINEFSIFSELPSCLISNTASYLSSRDYFFFARCSIKLYISCHAPCNLQHLTLRKYPSNLSLQRFKWIKSLIINIKYFNNNFLFDNGHYENDQIWKRNCIETLKLSNLNGNESDVATFMNNNCMTFNDNNLSKLGLANFGTNLTAYNGILFCKLLRNFNMINELILWDIHLSAGYILNSHDINKWFPRLTRFVCTYNVNQQLTQQIIYSIGHQLKALALWQVNNIRISNKGLPKLQELVLYIHGNSEILKCFKNANINTLKRVKISSDNKEMLKESICWILRQKNLEILQINVQSKYLKYTMQKVEENIINKKLKLILGFHCNWNDDMMQYIERMIFKLRDLLNNNTTSDFALRIRMENRRRYNVIDGDDIWLNMVEIWLNKLNNMSLTFNTMYEFKTIHCTDIFSFTISNKNCKIQGYAHNFIDLL